MPVIIPKEPGDKIYIYIYHFKDELRLDGRSFSNYRPIHAEFNNINNCYGSCQLTLVGRFILIIEKSHLYTQMFFFYIWLTRATQK